MGIGAASAQPPRAGSNPGSRIQQLLWGHRTSDELLSRWVEGALEQLGRLNARVSGQGRLICRLQKLQVIHFVPIDQAGAPIGHRVFPRGFSRLVRLGSATSRRSTTAGAGGAG